MQRLIDANKLANNIFVADSYSEPGVIDQINEAEPVLTIPDNPTNGDMIRALYGEPAKMEGTGVLYKFKYRNGKPMFSTYYDLDWWNSPYKRR